MLNLDVNRIGMKKLKILRITRIIFNKFTFYIVGIIIVAIFAIIFLSKKSCINIGNPFNAKAITIDKTSNIVEEINQLAELTTATYYQDVVIRKTKQISLFGKDEIVLIIKGKVRAGFDLSILTEQDIFVDSFSIKIRLPQVKIIDIITNPSDFETFIETGKWSFNEVNDFKKEAREKLEENAIDGGILELAEKSGMEKLTSLLQAFGFKEIIVELN